MTETDDPWVSNAVQAANPIQRSPDAVNRDRRTSILPDLYKWKRGETRPIDMIPSDIIPTGYACGISVGLVGSAASGKSRFAMQEVVRASIDGYQSLYVYNESPRITFDTTIGMATKRLSLEESLLENITWSDAHKARLSVASYDGIDNYVQNVLVRLVRKWLESKIERPRFVVFDSFSDLGRKFVPQMYYLNKTLLTELTNLYTEKDVRPVTLMIHQKSQTTREKNDESVAGGMGLIHDLDMVMVFQKFDVDKWDSMRYGFKEGTTIRALNIVKDRYQTDEGHEARLLHAIDGKLKLGPTLHEIVERVQKEKEVKKMAHSGYRDDWPMQEE